MVVVLPVFQDADLLTQALTHRSYINENPEAVHNERLEFLGDAILNFLSGEFLFKRYPDRPEGDLTPLRALLVEETQLAQFALWLELGPRLRLGRGAEQQGGRSNRNLLSSAFEAVVGAYFLDQQSQIEGVRDFVWPFFTEAIADSLTVSLQINYKSKLQEEAIARFKMHPVYRMVQSFGPDHAKEFEVEVLIQGQIWGRGQGRRKQDAEKMAAQIALQRLQDSELNQPGD